MNLLKHFVIIFCVTISFVAKANIDSTQRLPREISLKEAIDKKLLQLKICGAYDPRTFNEVVDKEGVHYGKCMAIILKSTIDSFVLLRLDCGTQLIPFDSSVQTMIVTQKAIFPLYPHSSYATRFYAMCGQLHDAAPYVETTFKVGDMANANVVKLANFLSENYFQNMIGQHAMWAITDNVEFDELQKYGADSASILKTKSILSRLNVVTKLSPKKIKKVLKTSNQIILDWYVFCAGSMLLLIATLISIIFVFKFRKLKKDLVTKND